MKRFLFFITVLVFSFTANAQVPAGFQYQAVVRDGAGMLYAGSGVQVRLSIHSGSSTGIVEWQEEHSVTTNQFGLMNLVVGEGTRIGGTRAAFADVAWGNAAHYIQVEVDLGNGYSDMGTSQLFAVPYALHAQTANTQQDPTWVIAGNNIYSPVKGNVGIGTQDPLAKLSVVDGSILFDGHIGSTPVEGGGTRFMWVPQKASLRAGIASIDDLRTAQNESEFWNDNNIGFNSAAFGKQTRALGIHSFATGFNTKAQSGYSAVFGRYNIDNGNPNEWLTSDPLFIIGNGTDESNLNNAVTVLKNGFVGLGVDSPTQNLDVLKRIRMRHAPPPLGKAYLAVSDTTGEGNFRWQNPQTFNDGKWLITDTVIGTMVNQNIGFIGIRNNFPDEIIHIGTALDTNDYFIKFQTATNNSSGIILAGDSTQIWKVQRNGATNELDISYNNNVFATMETTGELGIGIADPVGVLHLRGNKAGDSGNLSSYIAVVENSNNSSSSGSSANGLAVKLNLDFPDADNNYVTFFDDDEVRGRIEGQNASDVASDPEYILHVTLFALQLTSAIAEQVAAATSTTPCVGLGAVVCAPIPSWNVYAAINIGLTVAEEAAYQAFIFDNLGVGYESGSGDYAEWLEKADYTEQFSFGDIVAVNGGKISKNTEGAGHLMVVSLSPIVLGNMPPDAAKMNYEKIAFMGQVRTKVYGKVHAGDYILPSGKNDGYGIAVRPENMTAADFNRVVGRAWSESNSDIFGYVNVVVGLNSNDLGDVVAKQQEELNALKSEVANMKATLAKLLPEFEKLNQDVRGLQNTAVASSATTPYEPAPVDYQNITFEPEILAYSFSVLQNMYREKGIEFEKYPELNRLLTDRDYQQQKVKEVQHRITEAGDVIEQNINR